MLKAIIMKKASCPTCNQLIVLPDDAKPGDNIRCCGKDYLLTYEFDAFALEPYGKVGEN